MANDFTIGDLVTERELPEVKRRLGQPDFHSWCMSEIIEPKLAAINEKTGQQNDISYLAYAVEYHVGRLGWD